MPSAARQASIILSKIRDTSQFSYWRFSVQLSTKLAGNRRKKEPGYKSGDFLRKWQYW